MCKYRAEITKGEEIRYISHLDYAATIERAIRRAHLPAAYSEGFNPRLKMAFASALAVGVTSEAEYLDFELTEHLPQPEVFERLSAELPAGIKLLRLRQFAGKHKALMAEVDLARYQINVPLAGKEAAVKTAVTRFLGEKECIYKRVTPKKTREIEVKQYIEELQGAVDGKAVRLEMAIRITQSGSIKPGEILELLVEKYGLPVKPEQVLIHRLALWGQGKPLIELV